MPGPFVGNIFLECEGRGWTETYYVLGTTHAAAMSNLSSIQVNRATFSLAEVEFINLRVSDLTIRGDSNNQTPAQRFGTYVDAATSTADPDIALLVRQVGAGFLNRAVRYFRGLPLTTFDFNPIRMSVPPAGWTTSFNGFLAALPSQSQLVQRHPGTPPTYTTTAISSTVVERATIRRAGRPFGQQPGRRVRA